MDTLLWQGNRETETKLGHGDCVESESVDKMDGDVRVHIFSNQNEPETVLDISCGT